MSLQYLYHYAIDRLVAGEARVHLTSDIPNTPQVIFALGSEPKLYATTFIAATKLLAESPHGVRPCLVHRRRSLLGLVTVDWL